MKFSWSKIRAYLASGLMAIFLIVGAFGMVMNHDMDANMSNCIFSDKGMMECQMNLSEHLALWDQNFTGMLMVFAALVLFFVLRLTTLREQKPILIKLPISSSFFRRKNSSQRLY